MHVRKLATWVLASCVMFSAYGREQSTPSKTGRGASAKKKTSSLDEEISEAKATADKYSQLLKDLDASRYPDIAPVLTQEWIRASCLSERLTIQRIVSSNEAAASVYERCMKRMLADAGLSEPDRAAQPPPVAPVPPPIQPPAWCQVPTFSSFTPTDAPIDPIVMTGDTKSRTDETSLNFNSSGSEITTHDVVYLEYVNRLRYDASLSGNVTPIAATPIPGALTGGASTWSNVYPLTTTTQPGGKPAQQPPAPALPLPQAAKQADVDAFNRLIEGYQECFKQMQERLGDFQSKLNSAEAALNGTQEDIKTRLNDLGPVVNSVGEAKAAADLHLLPHTQQPAWPAQDITNFTKLASDFKNNLAALQKDKNYAAWAGLGQNQAGYEQLASTGDQFAKVVGSYAPNGTEATNYETSRRFVQQWRDQFRTVAGANKDYFIVEYQPACGGWFGQGTRTQMQLTLHDRLNPTAVDTTRNLDIVVCQPPITVSTGLGFSFIADKTPAFVPIVKMGSDGKPVLDSNGNPVIVQSLGYSSEARVRPAYSLQANTAIKEGKTNGLGFHWSLGTSLTDATSGATVDLFTGPSFSFRRRAFFVSPVLDFGRRTDYMSQFHVGELQGNLTSPPTESKWRLGFGLTITFPFTGTGTTSSTSSGNGQSASGSGSGAGGAGGGTAGGGAAGGGTAGGGNSSPKQ